MTSQRAISFLKWLIELLRPKFYNRITWTLIIAGLSMMSTPLWERLLEFALKTQFEIDITSNDTRWGFSLIVVALIYNFATTSLNAFTKRDEAVEGELPNFDLGFYDVVGQQSVEDNIEISGTYYETPKKGGIPDYKSTPKTDALGMPAFPLGAFERTNSEYYRQLASFISKWSSGIVLQIRLANVSGAVASDTNLRLLTDDDESISVHRLGEIPKVPTSQMPLLEHLHAYQSIFDQDIDVSRSDKEMVVTVAMGKLQPQETSYSNDFIFIQSRKSGTIMLRCQIFDDKLPAPLEYDIPLTCNIETRSLSVDDLISNGFDITLKTFEDHYFRQYESMMAEDD